MASQACLPNEGLGARVAVLLAVATRLTHAHTRTIQTFNPLTLVSQRSQRNFQPPCVLRIYVVNKNILVSGGQGSSRQKLRQCCSV